MRRQRRALKQGIEIDHPAFEPLSAGECQQMLGQQTCFFGRRASVAGADHDALRIDARPLGGVLDQLDVADHHLQQIVEIVGNATGQLPECFHVFAVTQTVLGVTAAADVHLRSEEIHQLSALVE